MTPPTTRHSPRVGSHEVLIAACNAQVRVTYFLPLLEWDRLGALGLGGGKS